MMLYFNFIMLVVCSHHCIKVTCVYGRQYLAVFCPCAVILLLANMWCGGWELDFVCVCICVCVCMLARTGGEGHGYHGNGCVGLIRGLPAGVGSEARLGKRTVRGEFASVQPWRSAGGGWGGLGLLPPHTSGFKGDPPTATTQSHWSLHWEQKSIEMSTAVPLSSVIVSLLSFFASLRISTLFLSSFPYFLSLTSCVLNSCTFLLLILFSSASGVCPINSFS